MRCARSLLGLIALLLACTSAESEPEPELEAEAAPSSPRASPLERERADHPKPVRAQPPSVHSTDDDPWLSPGDQPWRECARSNCWAGRVLVESIEDDTVQVKFLELWASSELHPNRERFSEEVELQDDEEEFEVGQTYVVILGGQGRQLIPLLVAPDGEAGVATATAIHRSPHAYENSLAWQARRRTWSDLATQVVFDDALFQITVQAWSESDDQRHLAFLLGDDALFIYDHDDGRLHINALDRRRSPSRVTFEDGAFVVWDDGLRMGHFERPKSADEPGGEPRNTLGEPTSRKVPAGVLAPETIDIPLSSLKLTHSDALKPCTYAMCYGGVIQIDAKDPDEWSVSYVAHFTTAIASSPGHPNGTPPESIEFVGDPSLGEPGDEATVVISALMPISLPEATAWRPGRSEAALDDVRAILGHELAYQNTPEDRRIHTLFDGYRKAWTKKNGEPAPGVGVWDTDPERRHLVTPRWIYDVVDDEFWFFMPQKSRPPGYNRVSYDGDHMFTLWYNDNAWLHIRA